uniref:Chloride channel CLIC-like protein 1 n=1 Tax=Rhipicephalus appendiculatus TaxID=34631 RepID=A0A131YM29_RHIAP
MRTSLTFVGVLLLSSSLLGTSRGQSVEPDSADVDDSFYRSRFGNGDTSRMRVILGDTEGWVNPHDMLGVASKPSSSSGKRTQRQSKLKKSSGARPEPISEDTTSPEARARIYSEIRARAAAESKKFSRYPAAFEEPDVTVVETTNEESETAKEESARSPTPTGSDGKQRSGCGCDCKAMQSEAKKCGEQVKKLRLSQVLADGQHDREFIYLRRLALNVIYSAKFGGDEMPSNVKFEILLSSDDVATLEKLAKDAGAKASQLEQKLSTILTSSVVTPDELPHGANALLGRLAQAWGQTMGPVDVRLAVPACAMLGVFLIILMRGRPWKAIILMSAFYFLLLSFVWHWALCYQLEHARRDAYISQNMVPPEHCQPGYSPGWLQRILGRASSAECEKYYESLHVDPVLQVNPLFVLSELLSKALFNPLSSLGTELGKFARNFAEHQTWWSLVNNVVNVICIGVLGVFAAMIFMKLFVFFYWTRPEKPRRERVEEVSESELRQPAPPPRRVVSPPQESLSSRKEAIEDDLSYEESGEEDVDEEEEVDERAGGDACCQEDAAKLGKT